MHELNTVDQSGSCCAISLELQDLSIVAWNRLPDCHVPTARFLNCIRFHITPSDTINFMPVSSQVQENVDLDGQNRGTWITLGTSSHW